MQTIIINGKFLSASMTGVHRVAMELSNALADLVAEGHPSTTGYAFEVWLPHDGIKNAQSIRLPTCVKTFLRGIPWEQITLPCVSRKHALLSLCNVGPVLRQNTITMIHDVQVHLTPKSYAPMFRLWYQIVQPLLARRNRHILTVSEFSRGEIANVGLCGPDKISVVHNGVDHVLRDNADPAILAKLGLDQHGYAVALSTTQAHKNISLLLKAFADPQLANVKLVLFGGTSRSDFEMFGQNIPPNVIFSGRVSDSELRALLESALCLAFPSTTEGFGLPPLEAMLLGCPAIVAPCGALPEVCGDASIYAGADDPQAWVNSIRRLADSPDERNLWSVRGQLHAKNFTWRAAAICLLDILSMQLTL
jgi:glycosyltransferase involved in cell wall biosynthesis